MTTPEIDPLLGRRIGHGLLQRKLGEGGLGAVYLAQHAGLNKGVAIKILPAQLAGNPDFIARFLREARLAARLEHPNVVQVYDVGQADGLYYISMQYVEGRGLDVLLKERGKLAVNEALSVTKRVATALEAARRLGIVHRDIKPANILVSKDGLVKVADFGLAKDREAQGTISEPGQIVGTPHYMSPEQAEGKAVDHRTDIYSLGATLYHMLSGRKPFDGPTPISIVVKAIQEEPAPLDPTVPAAVAALVRRMMAKAPGERPATCEEVVRAIDALKSAPVATSAGMSRQRRAAIVALPVVGILVVGIVLGLIMARGPERTNPSDPMALPAPKAEPTKPPDSPVVRPPTPEPPQPPEPTVVRAPKATKRAALLGAIQDPQERRLAEEVADRTDTLMKAVQAGDAAAFRGMLDRLTFGEAGEALAQELLKKRTSDGLELISWDFEELHVRPRAVGRPPTAQISLTYEFKDGGGVPRSAQGPPIHWVRRLDGGWFLTRAPR